eukprot:5347354-Pyramimonas_sp.AAC.1
MTRVARALCAGPRAIIYVGCASNSSEADHAIFAGCSLATSLARVLIYRLLAAFGGGAPFGQPSE